MNRLMMGLLMSVIIVGCTDPKQEKIQDLKSECIRVHDEVMPKLGEIVSLSSEINEMRKALVGDTTPTAEAERATLAAHSALLDAAHEAMMQWMEYYEVDYETSNPADSAIEYYTAELARIKEVSELMKKSIDNGKKVLESK